MALTFIKKDSTGAPAQFFFYEEYIGEVKTFVEHDLFKEYDVLVTLNEKVPSNRKVAVFYKQNLSLKTKSYIKNRIESRLKQYFALKKTRLTTAEYNAIQLPFDFRFVDANDPEGTDDTLKQSLLGFGFSLITFIFIFFYSNQVMRGVIEEKTNRVVEVIISSVKPFSPHDGENYWNWLGWINTVFNLGHCFRNWSCRDSIICIPGHG